MTGHVFDPTTQATPAHWLDLDVHLQLDRELKDLPALAELLERHYFDLLSKGDRDPDDSAVRYVVKADVLDLADRRHKPDPDPDPRPRFGDKLDPAGIADLARRAGARRLGILPTLESWVRCYEADLLDAGLDHITPVLDGRSTVTTAAGWLSANLDWIATQPGSEQLVAEVHDIVTGLDRLGINLDGPDHRATGTVRELAEQLDIPTATIYSWIRLGYLTRLPGVRPHQYVRHEVITLRNNKPVVRDDGYETQSAR